MTALVTLPGPAPRGAGPTDARGGSARGGSSGAATRGGSGSTPFDHALAAATGELRQKADRTSNPSSSGSAAPSKSRSASGTSTSPHAHPSHRVRDGADGDGGGDASEHGAPAPLAVPADPTVALTLAMAQQASTTSTTGMSTTGTAPSTTDPDAADDGDGVGTLPGPVAGRITGSIGSGATAASAPRAGTKGSASATDGSSDGADASLPSTPSVSAHGPAVDAATSPAAAPTIAASPSSISTLSPLATAAPPTLAPMQPMAPAGPDASTAPASTPVATPGDPQPVLLNSLAQLRSRPDGVHEISVMLHPAELGAVQVRATLFGGRLDITVVCSDSAARAAVTDALPSLHRQLAALGATEVRTADSVPHPGGTTAVAPGSPSGWNADRDGGTPGRHHDPGRPWAGHDDPSDRRERRGPRTGPEDSFERWM